VSGKVEVKFIISEDQAQALRQQARAFDGEDWAIESIVWELVQSGRRWEDGMQRAYRLQWLYGWPGHILGATLLTLVISWVAWKVWFPWLTW
jgi:Ca2+-dependent lipid-binding protein